MKKRKKKNAITLLALVITIVIMLLLAGVAIQMTMGENGLIAKSKEAQKAQAKTELYETAKLSYTNLKAKALENREPSPQAELALSTTEFTNKYNIVGDDVTDKKGNVIETKANVLNVLQGTVAGRFSPGTSTGTTTPAVYKTVGGVPILEDDKDKLILKLIAKSDTIVSFGGIGDSFLSRISPIDVDYGNGEKGKITDLYNIFDKQYNRGEYILKLKNIKDFELKYNGDFEIEILQWGKILEKDEKNIIKIPNVSKIYEPEPDKIPIEYINIKLTEIPEWLFSKKVTSTVMSKFGSNNSIVSIPEELFKNNVNVISFDSVFSGCSGITSIPEGLFKNNVNIVSFDSVFSGCSGITSIPEGLFNNNVNVTNFRDAFRGCNGITSIPEGLFKNNANVIYFTNIFFGCSRLTRIPVRLFYNNVNVKEFNGAFENCSGITSIPEGLFDRNVNVKGFGYVFQNCSGLTNIPNSIIKFANEVRMRGGIHYLAFRGCTAASNYASIPDSMKEL